MGFRSSVQNSLFSFQILTSVLCRLDRSLYSALRPKQPNLDGNSISFSLLAFLTAAKDAPLSYLAPTVFIQEIAPYPRKLDFNWDSCFTDDFHFTRKKKHPEVAYRSHEFFDPSLAPAFPTRASHNQYDSSRERVRKMLPRPFFRGVALDSLVSKCSNFCSIREDFGAQPFKYVQEWRARGFFGGNLAFFRD